MTRHWRLPAFVAAVIARWCSEPGLAYAETRVPTVVELRVAGPADLRLPLEASLREAIVRVGLSLQADGGHATGAASLAVVTIDVGQASTVRIAIEDAQRGRLVVERDVPTINGFTVAREDAVLVVRSALDALLETFASPPPVPVPVPAPAPAPVAASPPVAPEKPAVPAAIPHPRVALSDARTPKSETEPAPLAADVSAMFRVASFADGGPPVFGAAVRGELRPWSGPWRPAFELGSFVTFPSSTNQPGIEATLTTVGVRGLVKLSLADQRGWGADVGVGLGADVLLLHVNDTVPGAQLMQPSAAFDPVFVAQLSGRAPLAGAVGLAAAIGIDGDLGPQRFVADNQGAHLPVVAPLPVRAFVTVGVLFHLTGAEGS